MGLLRLQITPENVLLERLRGDKRGLGVLGVLFPRKCIGDGMAYRPVQPESALISSPFCPVTAGHVEASV